MNLPWEIIAEHLRNELQGYGSLLQLFINQQDNLLRGDSDAVLASAHEIEAQARATMGLRDRREEAVRAFATAHGQPASMSLRKLLPHFPDEVRPLLSALIDEINHLIHRVRRGARRNHSILTRAVEIHQETLRTLRPAAFSKTYSPAGEVKVAGEHPGWQAAG